MLTAAKSRFDVVDGRLSCKNLQRRQFTDRVVIRLLDDCKGSQSAEASCIRCKLSCFGDILAGFD